MPTTKARKHARIEETGDEICSFCGQVSAAVAVQMPVLFRKKRAPTCFCLTCYYTTSAVRQNCSKFVSVLSREQLNAQLVPMQQLFSEAFIDLKRKLREESEKAFSMQKSDPLALLHSGSGMAPRRMSRAPKPGETRKAGHAADGGFLKSVPLPERLLRTQLEQQQLQQAQISRLNQLAKRKDEPEASALDASSVYNRRKPSKKSIWNLAMDPCVASMGTEEGEEAARTMEEAPPCSCGSRHVRAFGNITSRNQDLKKGETWGMKDRGGEVVSRYQCNDCGKMWNEES